MNAPIELLKRAGNEALRVNPTVADIDITTHGSDWLWAVFSVMAATGLGTMIWSLKLSRGERAFHYLSAAILATASVAYFSMASDLGATPVRVEFTTTAPLRSTAPAPPAPSGTLATSTGPSPLLSFSSRSSSSPAFPSPPSLSPSSSTWS